MSVFKPRYFDGQILDLGGLMVRLKVNRRARRISLRIDRRSGEALALSPTLAKLNEAASFARSRRDWLSARLSEAGPPPAPLRAGESLTVLNEAWQLEPDGRRPRLTAPSQDGARILRGCGAGAVDVTLVARMVKREGLCAFEARAAAHCDRLGLAPPPLRLIDARTRWGSCTPAQNGRSASIRLSWRLALAPFAVADYVVAHECAHLLEANHGPRFWDLVRDLVGDYKASRAWLRSKGNDLHGLLAPRPA